MKSINRFLIDKGYSGNDEEISILKMVELVDEWQGDSQNITIKLIQFTEAISECMNENLRLESQLEERENYKYCPYCGNKLEHQISTDANTDKVCKSVLCKTSNNK